MKIEFAQDAGTAKLRKAFEQLGSKKLGRDVMRVAAGAMQEASDFAFSNERDPNTGEKWVPWSDDYKDWREEHGFTPGKIMTLSGQLASSLTTEYGDNWAVIGTNKIYGAIHQWGGLPGMAPGPAAIPARQYMGLDDVGESMIFTKIEKSLDSALSGI